MSVSDKKAQLLKALLRKKGLASTNERSAAEKIRPLNRDGINLPLSYAQEQLWFQGQLFPDSPVYNIPVALCIRGDVNLGFLTQSLKKIVLRHEALRTTFHQTDFKPVAIVNNTAELSVDLIQTSGTKLNSRERILSEMKKAVRCVFDLENDLLIKATIWNTDFGECYLLLVVHHIVSDGWSVSILLDELTEFYNAAIRESSGDAVDHDSKALPINYIDFSQWQRDAQNSDKNRQHLAYWKEKLSGELPVIDLPVDFARPSVATFNGAIRKIQLSDEMSQHLNKCCKHYKVTNFMFLLSVFNILMSRYSGLEDILVGTPVNSRSQKDLEKIIGYFINTLVLRTDLSDNPAFSELLARTRDNVLEAFEHQDTPLGSLTDELEIGRDLAQSTLFQVMFSLQNVPERTLAMEGLETELIPYDLLHTKTSKVDLNMVVESREAAQKVNQEVNQGANQVGGRSEGLNIWLEYNADIFNCDSIDKFLTHFRALLENVLESPEKKLSNLKMLSTEEENTFLADLSHSAQNYHSEDLLHNCFNRQVELNPQGIALQYEAQTLTYTQLDQLSNKLANYLLKYKTGPDVLIGICLQRSIDLIVGILAILKTGSAYVPLDPAAPASRLEFIVEDAEIPVLITEEKYFNIFSSQASQLSLLDINNNEIEKCNDSAILSAATPENIAYVIYTSGSTGRPKGVLVEHRNVIRLFSATDEWYRFSSDDVWTLFHSCTFDFSVWEIWGALFYGARLIVVPYWVSRSPDDFYKLLCDEQVTVLNQTPSAFRQLSNVDLQLEERADLALRYVIFGGEALDTGSLRPWFERHGDQIPKLVNMYGITETTVHVTYRPLSLEDVDAENGSVIGLPIPDLQIYLLDRYLNLVPAGVKGEIFVAGGGVARGYLNRPSLNEERFIDDHITPGATSKLYRSGDLARFLPDGDMEYLGRMDDQVKIRGFRIELGEIETTLNSAVSIRQAVVMLQTDASGTQCIVAYYVLSEGEVSSGFNIDVLRTYLGNNLPDYMIPQYFIEVEHFTLTSNGKIDRRALPLPGDVHQVSGSEYIAPRNALEKELAAIWSDVIDLEKIGIHDNFFNIGGHSLLATQVVSRIKNHFEIDLPLRSLFDAGCISELALQIKEQQNAQTTPRQVQIEKRKGDTPAALSFAQQRLWY
ncbi:MAG TPA: amino acid adenylation domain-containing protein, partial [Gammaproteobacteria bacterium]|nr:amino acid adenylation domain-containing protein [Gammaproteobacteria bacterium]